MKQLLNSQLLDKSLFVGSSVLRVPLIIIISDPTPAHGVVLKCIRLIGMGGHAGQLALEV